MTDALDKYGRAAEPEKRRPAPLSVALAVALRQMIALMRQVGIIPSDVPDEAVKLELDHTPALILRDVDPATRHHIPHQHEPSALEWLYKPGHDIKTRGRGATTAGSDTGKAKKLRRLVEARRTLENVEERVADPDWAEKPSQRKKPKHKWAKRPFPKGRGFQKSEQQK